MNAGAYGYVAPRLTTAMRSVGRGTFEDLKFVGRPPSAAPSTGFPDLHAREQREVVGKSFQKEPIVMWGAQQQQQQ